MNYIEIEKYKRKYKVEIGIGVYNEINFIKNTLDSVIRNYKYIDHIILYYQIMHQLMEQQKFVKNTLINMII